MSNSYNEGFKGRFFREKHLTYQGISVILTTCKEKNFTGGFMSASIETSLTTPEELVVLAELYDRYGELFKEDQREIFEYYVYENLSLGELSEKYSMTRQGIYDKINRIRRKLREYEDKLHLIEREKHLVEIISEAKMDPVERERLLAEIEEVFDASV